MLQKIIYILFILSTLTFYSYGIHISEYDETKLIFTINSQLSELRARQEKLTKEVAKDSDTQILRSDIQFIRAEIERQKNCVAVKEAENESSKSDIQSLRAELDNLKNEKESAIQFLRAEIQVFRTELKQQKKCVIDKEGDNQSLRADIHVFKTDIQNLKAELEQQKKHILDREADNQIQEKQEKLKRQESDKPRDCTAAKSSGIHDIVIPKFSIQPFKAACDAETQGGGWTIILRRMDGSVNFYRNWTEYKNGFGNLDGEYFLGLDKIHAMTAERRQELLVVLEDFEGDERFETYDAFAIGDEDQQYELHTLGEASGIAKDALKYHHGWKFSTFDKDNDNWDGVNCAVEQSGAWWYDNCSESQLTGTYKDNGFSKGVNWIYFRGLEYSLKTAIMMIRPKK